MFTSSDGKTSFCDAKWLCDMLWASKKTPDRILDFQGIELVENMPLAAFLIFEASKLSNIATEGDIRIKRASGMPEGCLTCCGLQK